MLISLNSSLSEGLGVFGVCNASSVCVEKTSVVPINLLVISGRVWYHLRPHGFFYSLGSKKNRVCFIFRIIYFIVFACRIFILCLVGFVSLAHLATQREK